MFRTTNFLIWLTQTELWFWSKKVDAVAQNLWQQSIAGWKFGQISDAEVFRQQLGEQLTTQGIDHQLGVVVFGHDLIYPQVITETQELNARKTKFLSQVPLPAAEIGFFETKQNEQLQLVAIHYPVVREVLAAVAAAGGKIVAATAANLLPNSSDLELHQPQDLTNLQPDQLKTLCRAVSQPTINFLGKKPLVLVKPEMLIESNSEASELSTDSDEPAHHPVSKSQLLILFISTMIFLTVSGYVAKNYLNLTPQPIPTPIPSPTPTPIPSPSPIGVPEASQREAINISILNGSGVSGAANKLKQQLTELGYTKITTGNNPKTSKLNSISMHSDIPIEVSQEVYLFLTGLQSDSVISSDSANPKPDLITIILGQAPTN